MDAIRIGVVSAVDADTGMVSVIYEDRDNETTGYLPYFSPGEEYAPPKLQDKVLVVYGKKQGIVIGKFWNKENVPDAHADGCSWHKRIADKAFMNYDIESDTLTIKAPNIVFESDGNMINLSELAGD